MYDIIKAAICQIPIMALILVAVLFRQIPKRQMRRMIVLCIEDLIMALILVAALFAFCGFVSLLFALLGVS